MESHGKIPWYFVNYPNRGLVEKKSTTAIDRGFLYNWDKTRMPTGYYLIASFPESTGNS